VTRRTLFAAVAVTLVLVAVTGCGRRGDLEPPGPAASLAEPNPAAALVPQPSPVAAPAASASSLLPPPTVTAAGASEWQDEGVRDPLQTPPARKVSAKPQRPFILDGLLN
jgi:predicted small lipoprotein YifL